MLSKHLELSYREKGLVVLCCVVFCSVLFCSVQVSEKSSIDLTSLTWFPPHGAGAFELLGTLVLGDGQGPRIKAKKSGKLYSAPSF